MTVSCRFCRTADMGKRTFKSCAGCHRLTQVVRTLQAEDKDLKEQLAAARKNSSTSSKPPSSDIVKPTPPAPPPGQDKRKQGGQHGHPKHERALFPPEQVTHPFEHVLHGCPCCGGKLHHNTGL